MPITDQQLNTLAAAGSEILHTLNVEIIPNLVDRIYNKSSYTLSKNFDNLTETQSIIRQLKAIFPLNGHTGIVIKEISKNKFAINIDFDSLIKLIISYNQDLQEFFIVGRLGFDLSNLSSGVSVQERRTLQSYESLNVHKQQLLQALAATEIPMCIKFSSAESLEAFKTLFDTPLRALPLPTPTPKTLSNKKYAEIETSIEEYGYSDIIDIIDLDESGNRHLACPLTMLLMRDPVVLGNTGSTFERSAITTALANNPNRNPLTNQPIYNTMLQPNYFARDSILGFLKSELCKKLTSEIDRSAEIPVHNRICNALTWGYFEKIKVFACSNKLSLSAAAVPLIAAACYGIQLNKN